MFFTVHNIRTFCSQSVLLKNAVQLTKDKFPNLKRGSYATVNACDVDYFKKLLGDNNFITGEEVKAYNEDWLKSVCGKYLKFKFLLFVYYCIGTHNILSGSSKYVLKPKTTEQLSEILKHCNKRNIAVSVQAGNTGLVGGSVPVFDEIILSTSAMNKIISFNKLSGRK